jgi:D-beta-D-heptose 7-phosphate kinase / D-beta-D-heptose 1-phosphate adenosyltransferase
MSIFEDALRLALDQTVLCVGDLMLDNFVYGEVSRVSPEAPAPVIAVTREDKQIGGAGNVARNIAGLGARCIFIGVCGNDEAGGLLRAAFDEFKDRIEPHLVVDSARPTTRKLRFVSEHYSTHLLRADWELAKPVDAAIEDRLIAAATDALPRAGAVVLSDYAKGTLTPRVIRAVIEAARERGKPVIVDPKATDYAVYRGATVITPNRKELGEATRRPVVMLNEVAAAAGVLSDAVESRAVLVTLSEDGLMLHRRNAPHVHIPAYSAKIRDVSGAGDTVVATFAVWLALGAEFEEAARAANAAASVVVEKRGTASLSLAELRGRLLPSAVLAAEEKIIFDWALLDERLAEWRRRDLRVGFTNGCFDLLHPGHVHLLTQARAACDGLVVGLNSDASVAGLKGSNRPIQDVHARALVLAALEAVDLVVVFEQATPLELLGRVKPNVLVKGSDYRIDQVVGRELVEADGGQVVLVDLLPGHSTSALVRKSVHPPDGQAKKPKVAT